MPAVSDALTAHHRRSRELLAQVADAVRSADWQTFATRLVALREDLLGHFHFEEERLFPVYEEVSGLREATQQLRTQHDDIRAILWALSSASAAHDPDGCRREFGVLDQLFRQHAKAEEDMMYPAFERSLGAQAVAEAAAASADALDVRGLEAPQPFLLVMQKLSHAPERPLRVRIDREPQSLYAVLQEQGFAHRARPLPDGGFEIVIECAAR